MDIFTTADQLVRIARPMLVPTMGALHAGHASLIAQAAQWAKSSGRPVLVSIFVNPTQFGPSEDFRRYPRTLEVDLAVATNAGADAVFAPPLEVMYPSNAQIAVPRLPAVATQPGLEDARRPGHFAGVCQVVARLFDLTQPCMAFFGEKDYQQLQVLRAMVQQVSHDASDRWADLQIQSAPTIRESDGLAMSSRNAYLSEIERRRALGLFSALTAARHAGDPADAESIMRDVLETHQLQVEYAVARDAATLMPIESLSADQPARPRLLIAARCGSTRLIDNMACGPAP